MALSSVIRVESSGYPSVWLIASCMLYAAKANQRQSLRSDDHLHVFRNDVSPVEFYIHLYSPKMPNGSIIRKQNKNLK